MTKINNPVTKVNVGIDLNDKDFSNLLLCSLKEMEKCLCVCMTEASNDFLYNKYVDMFNEVSNLQRKVFDFAFYNGWYILESVSDTKLNEKLKMLTDEYVKLRGE